uniref:Uncharacterized protein n=1 Tax=Salix viminalis TaxID=40686 RepID=A0A6N2M8Y9_SALVM
MVQKSVEMDCRSFVFAFKALEQFRDLRRKISSLCCLEDGFCLCFAGSKWFGSFLRSFICVPEEGFEIGRDFARVRKNKECDS